MALRLTCVQARLQPLKRFPAQERPWWSYIHRQPALVVRLQHRVHSHRNECPQGLPVMPAGENRPVILQKSGEKTTTTHPICSAADKVWLEARNLSVVHEEKVSS